MAVYSKILFYEINPFGLFTTTTGGTTVYTGPATAAGVAQITDNEAGIQGQTLDDDNDGGGGGGETATANVRIGALTSLNSSVDAENTWTLQDTVTGEIFQIVRFDVENGAAAGDYLISEIPLVAGRSYITLAHDNNANVSAGDPVLNYNDYYAGWADEIVDGTGGDDVIDNTYTDPDGDVIDGGDGTGPAGNEDVVDAGAGNDTILSGAGSDTVYAGTGDDTIDGGAGDDVIYGDSVAPRTEFLDWSAAGRDGTNLEGGFTQNTGTMNVTMGWVDNGGSSPTGAQVESSLNIYTDIAEPFDSASSLFISGAGGENASTTTISFAGAPGSGMSDEVENLSFRLNDIDSGGFIDIITINAFDDEGNPVAVTITPSGNDTVSGNTITGGPGGDQLNIARGSALVEIAGPVATFELVYQNGGNVTQFVYVSDIHFDTIPDPITFGDDTIAGGLGADVMYGEGGDDTFTVSDGDTALGGDGDDTFNLADLAEAGTAPITIVGGETGETGGDTLNFNDLIDSRDDITFTETDDNAGGLSGFVTLNNGTLVTFSEIETIIVCFAPGALIETVDGPRAVETLQPGDHVMTMDRGPQPIRWVSSRDLPLDDVEPDAKPVLIRAGALGPNRPDRDIIVSPQHRVLVGEAGQMTDYFPTPAFVHAKSLTALPGIRHMVGKKNITWHHFACDRHEVVTANGCQMESLLLGPMVLKALSASGLSQLSAIFGPQVSGAALNGPTARPCLTVGEVVRHLEAVKNSKKLVSA